jgi:heat shock protein 5
MLAFILALSIQCEYRKRIGTTIGIDLGTTFSRVSVSYFGEISVFANKHGSRLMPSVVAFHRNQSFVGESAKAQLITNPRNTIFGITRLLGRKYSDAEVQNELNRLPYRVIDRDGRPWIEIEDEGEGKVISAEEISGKILREMKELAEAHLGKAITDAVVTVPASFNQAQRQAVKNAGAFAGLTIRRVLNAPIGAAIAYRCNEEETRNVLVFDLGGGSFDASLFSINDLLIEMLATSGDGHLGGEDFDDRVANHFLEVFRRRTGKDASVEAKSVGRLKIECEKAKRSLSTEAETRIEIEDFFEGEDLSAPLTRALFDDLNIDLFQKTIGHVEQVLKDAGVSRGEVADIILVGGSTHLPKVRQLVSDFFDGKVPFELNDPDEAIAYGAAVYGGLVSRDFGTPSPQIMSAIPRTIGVETVGGAMAEVFPRNWYLPADKYHTFVTSEDNQESIRFEVFEGENAFSRDNHFLSAFEITGLPHGPRGTVEANVTFRLSKDGFLKVHYGRWGSSVSPPVVLDARDVRFPDEEKQAVILVGAEWAPDRQWIEKGEWRRRDLEEDLRVAQVETERNSASGKLTPRRKEAIDQKIAEVREWLNANPSGHQSLFRKQSEELSYRVSFIRSSHFE